MSSRFTELDLAEFMLRKKKWDAEGTTRKHSCQGPIPEKPGPKKKIPRERILVSNIEERFAYSIELHKFPKPVREYFHIQDRRFRLDFAWPDLKIGVEVQGMVHRIRGRFKADIEKRALTLLAGWRVLEVGRDEILDGTAIKWLEQLWAVSSA